MLSVSLEVIEQVSVVVIRDRFVQAKQVSAEAFVLVTTAFTSVQ